MKPRQAAALAARVVVAGVLIYAGASKAAGAPEEFKNVIDAYDLLPRDLTLAMAALLPWVELLVGWALLLGVRTRAASASAGSLFAVFLTMLGQAAARGIKLPNCGCFGETIHVSTSHALLLDTALAALCWLSWSAQPGPASLDAWVERGR